MSSFWLFKTPLFYLFQPLWRDEAFSVLLSRHSPGEIIKLTAADFNPPLYYLLLHFYMRIFGSGEMVIRLLSLAGHLLAVLVMFKLAKRFFFTQNKMALWLVVLLTVFNPMLLYYAFEARIGRKGS